MKNYKKNFINKFALILTLLVLVTNINCMGTKIKGNGVIVEETRDVVDFTKINVSGAIKVELTQGGKYEVIVKTDENLVEHIITKQKKGALYIHRDKKNIKPTVLIVYVTLPELEYLKVTGACELVCKNTFKLKDLDCKFSGACDIDLDFTANNFNCDISGASKIDLNGEYKKSDIKIDGASDVDCNFIAETTSLNMSGASALRIAGTTTDMNIKISGASSLRGYKFISAKTIIRANGASDAYIYTKESLNAISNGASTIKVKGEPTKKTIIKSGAGTVRLKKE